MGHRKRGQRDKSNRLGHKKIGQGCKGHGKWDMDVGTWQNGQGIRISSPEKHA